MNDTQRQRFDRIFDFLDTDGSGAIGREDFEALAQHILAATGTAPNSPKARALHDAYRKGWEALSDAADLDGDGRVTRQEFLSRIADPDEGEHSVRRAIDVVGQAEFQAIDADDDGTISHDELQRVLVVRGASGQQAATAFHGLDTDGDGYISLNEYRRAWESFYRADAQDTHGESLQAIFA
ncbi:Ca2+-binding EF-hand superfamily protein [Actinocorallia herbida]|uniref:Ca2+-binding EF-hand superfamily protein n=1 Tax=Actinocorallia herbida TaxID=58109 RepID=A0A3N1CZX8_9ACTN|nr:EF-hand domain-containing protein [Actinocorallia herbida]ROO86843.1 Ca2+-binding EF-hand superfamily protein [Actinocorallia herbida]